MKKMRATETEGWVEFIQKGPYPKPAFRFQISNMKDAEDLTPEDFRAELLEQAEHIARAYETFCAKGIGDIFQAWLEEMRVVLSDAAGRSLWKHKNPGELALEYFANQNRVAK